MTRSAWIWLALAAPVCGQGLARCYVEVEAAPTAMVEAPLVVTVTVGWDRSWFKEHAVAMVRRPSEVTWYLSLPWLEGAGSWVAKVLPPRAAAVKKSVIVEGAMRLGAVLPDVARDGRAFARLQLRAQLVPLVAGRHQLAPARVQYAYATEFRDHLLRGREPVDRREANVSSAAHTLEVEPAATDGPPDYTGAIGDLEVSLLSGGEEVAVGEVFEVVMTVAGDERTNLGRFGKPRIGGLDGFHVQGVLEEPLDGARQFRISVLALREGMRAVEGISLVTYSPQAGAFRRLGGEPVPVRVVARREGAPLSAAVEQLIREDARGQGGGAAPWRWVLPCLAVAGLLLQRFGSARRRRGRLERVDAGLRVAVASGDAAACATAFEQLLACVGGTKSFAADSIWGALERRGVAAAGVRRLRALHAALDQARFGGPPPDAADLLAAADTLLAAARG